MGHTWDNNGNLLDDGPRSYTYDTANRLIKVVSGTLTTTYTYNGDGHRMAKTENGVTTSYVVAVLGLSQVLVETTGRESIVYLYGHDGSAALTTGLLTEEDDTWKWHLSDGLGSMQQLADSERARYPEIPWTQIVGLRNRLIHGYDAVDLDTLFFSAFTFTLPTEKDLTKHCPSIDKSTVFGYP